MTLTPSRALASSGVDRFSPSQLLRTARLLASDPQLSSLVDHHRAERRWVELDSSPYLQIWLLSWPAGTETGWHDHGESAGAFLTVSGSLTEQTSPDHRRHDRTLTVGEGRPFGRGHIHKVANDSLEAASPCTSTPPAHQHDAVCRDAGRPEGEGGRQGQGDLVTPAGRNDLRARHPSTTTPSR